MGTRLELHGIFVKLLGNESVYYDPPETIKLSYPAIVYSKADIDIDKADDVNYRKKTRYDFIVIDRHPDNPVIDKLLELPYCSYDRAYVSDNLHHDSLIIYY